MYLSLAQKRTLRLIHAKRLERRPHPNVLNALKRKGLIVVNDAFIGLTREGVKVVESLDPDDAPLPRESW